MRVRPKAVIVATLALLGGALTWVTPPPASAFDRTMVVTTTADDTNPDNACSLREAVENAATDYPLNQDCTYGGGSSSLIVFDLPDPSTILLLGTLTIEDFGATVIDGGGSVTIEGRGDDLTMLSVVPSAAVTLTGLTLQRPANVGALRGIQSSGNLVVRDSTFQNFKTPIGSDGAGILAEGGTLTVTGSTFSRNDAGSGGAAIRTSVGGMITNSTFYANDASRGAGVYADGTAAVSFNTFVDNTATGDAALYGSGITYSANVFQGNDGVYSGVCNDGSVDGGYNVTDDSSCKEVASTLVASPGLPAGAPTANGGPTATFALVAGSPAVDFLPADYATCPELDQRGFVRPAGSSCDAGAYELGALLPDVTAPVVTVPADITVQATGADGAVVTFAATANDDRDGALTPNCTPPSGSTFVLGTTTVTCTATDAAGNTGSAEFLVTVTPQPTVYDFSGLLAPIDALPTLNKAKAGSSVPVKFSLGGDFGLDVLAAGSPGSQDVPCGSGATDTLEQTVSTNKSGLTYDAATGIYSYVWSTKKSWAGTCRNLNITLTDGTSQTVAFAFR